jgi:hypothetical protein
VTDGSKVSKRMEAVREDVRAGGSTGHIVDCGDAGKYESAGERGDTGDVGE